MSQFMGEMSIERIETRAEASSSDLPVSNKVAIYWKPSSVLCVWCFNGNIHSSWYFHRFTRSLLSTEIQVELHFYRHYIVDLW